VSAAAFTRVLLAVNDAPTACVAAFTVPVVQRPEELTTEAPELILRVALVRETFDEELAMMIEGVAVTPLLPRVKPPVVRETVAIVVLFPTAVKPLLLLTTLTVLFPIVIAEVVRETFAPRFNAEETFAIPVTFKPARAESKPLTFAVLETTKFPAMETEFENEAVFVNENGLEKDTFPETVIEPVKEVFPATVRLLAIFVFDRILIVLLVDTFPPTSPTLAYT
jgi:hypothetical protein